MPFGATVKVGLVSPSKIMMASLICAQSAIIGGSVPASSLHDLLPEEGSKNDEWENKFQRMVLLLQIVPQTFKESRFEVARDATLGAHENPVNETMLPFTSIGVL